MKRLVERELTLHMINFNVMRTVVRKAQTDPIATISIKLTRSYPGSMTLTAMNVNIG